MKILIIEDEPKPAADIGAYLSAQDYLCEYASTWSLAREKVELYRYQCILLDLMLPGGDGLDVLDILKKQGQQDGVIIISAKNDFETKIKGLRAGAEIWPHGFSLNVNANLYHNSIDAFSVENRYPVRSAYSARKQQLTSGSAKINALMKGKKMEVQVALIYQAPDIIPQGSTGYRFSVDAGAKRQLGKGELFVNATDLFGMLVIRKMVFGDGFHYTSRDYYETQLIRAGYSFKF